MSDPQIVIRVPRLNPELLDFTGTLLDPQVQRSLADALGEGLDRANANIRALTAAFVANPPRFHAPVPSGGGDR